MFDRMRKRNRGTAHGPGFDPFRRIPVLQRKKIRRCVGNETRCDPGDPQRLVSGRFGGRNRKGNLPKQDPFLGTDLYDGQKNRNPPRLVFRRETQIPIFVSERRTTRRRVGMAFLREPGNVRQILERPTARKKGLETGRANICKFHNTIGTTNGITRIQTLLAGTIG